MPSQKKILVVTQHFWPENFRINDIVEGFLQDGIAVDVLCGLPNYPKGEWFPGYSAAGPFEEEWHGARLYRCKEVPRRGNTSVNIFLNYISWPWYAAHALHRLPGGYDAGFCFNTSPVLMCWPAIRYAKKHHIPFTNYVLDIWPENLYSVLNVKNKALRAIAQGVSDALYKKADRLIAMSEPLQQRLGPRPARRGMPPQKIAVIPQYCEDFYAVPQPDAALQAQFGGRFNLVFTGTFTPAQSLETVITAVQDARSRGADMLHLLLVGDGMSRAALEAKVKELPAEDAVTFYGSVPATDIPKFTALADALIVCLSDSPDLGLTVPAKVASYMAAGKPVLASMDGAGKAAGGAAVTAAGRAASMISHLLPPQSVPETSAASPKASCGPAHQNSPIKPKTASDITATEFAVFLSVFLEEGLPNAALKKIKHHYELPCQFAGPPSHVSSPDPLSRFGSQCLGHARRAHAAAQ